MTRPRMPVGFAAGGKLLWKSLVTDEMPEHLVALLTEACRARDRLDRLDRVLRGDARIWTEILCDQFGEPVKLQISPALDKANITAGVLQRLIAQIPAPAAVAAPAKGVTSGGNGNPVTPLDKARQARQQAGASKSTRARTAARRRPRPE